MKCGDIWIYLTKFLDIVDCNSIFRLSKYHASAFANNPRFWRSKLNRDYSQHFNINVDKSYKERYRILYSQGLYVYFINQTMSAKLINEIVWIYRIPIRCHNGWLVAVNKPLDPAQGLFGTKLDTPDRIFGFHITTHIVNISDKMLTKMRNEVDISLEISGKIGVLIRFVSDPSRLQLNNFSPIHTPEKAWYRSHLYNRNAFIDLNECVKLRRTLQEQWERHELIIDSLFEYSNVFYTCKYVPFYQGHWRYLPVKHTGVNIDRYIISDPVFKHSPQTHQTMVPIIYKQCGDSGGKTAKGTPCRAPANTRVDVTNTFYGRCHNHPNRADKPVPRYLESSLLERSKEDVPCVQWHIADNQYKISTEYWVTHADGERLPFLK